MDLSIYKNHEGVDMWLEPSTMRYTAMVTVGDFQRRAVSDDIDGLDIVISECLRVMGGRILETASSLGSKTLTERLIEEKSH